MTAPPLARQSEPDYEGPLRATLDTVGAVISFFEPLRESLPSDFVTLLDGLAESVKTGSDEESEAVSLVNRDRLMRDRVVEMLVEKGGVVEFERFGDDLRYPGELIYSKVAANAEELKRSADFSALFSGKDLSKLISDGEKLADKYEEIGIPVERPTLGAAFPILAVIIAVIVAIVALYLAMREYDAREGFQQKALDQLEDLKKQGILSDESYLDGVSILARYQSVMSSVVAGIPWDTVVLGGLAIAAVVYIVPAMIAKKAKRA